jgi:hypothetical protein
VSATARRFEEELTSGLDASSGGMEKGACARADRGGAGAGAGAGARADAGADVGMVESIFCPRN